MVDRIATTQRGQRMRPRLRWPVRVKNFCSIAALGAFQLLFRPACPPTGRSQVQNRSEEPIPNVIFFENHDGRIGYSTAGAIENTVTFDAPSLDGSLPQL